MSLILNNFRAAIQTLREQTSRAILAALGITVSTIGIILLVSIALGVREDVTDQIEDLGVNVVIVLPGRVELGNFNPNIGGQSYLKESYAQDLKREAGVLDATPLTFAGGGVKAGSQQAYPMTVATTSVWFNMRPVKLKYGKVFSDPKTTDRVAVLGSIASESLFGEGANPVGKEVKINGQVYRVIGVTEDKKSESSLFSMGGLQNVTYIPFHALKATSPNVQVDRIMVQTDPESDPKTLVKRLDGVLSKRLDYQQFSVLTQEDLLGLVFKIMSILTWLLTGLTSISLFVGGIGIMNVMLMSVTERIKEIGVRKTVGARHQDIFYQFLAESITLSIAGATLGLSFSAIVIALLKSFTVLKPTLTWGVIALAYGTSLVVGIASGITPALHASRKDPVDALRAG